MLSTMFEKRDRKLLTLIKLGDCLGRSLRENVILFNVDSKDNSVIYLTETNQVIRGTYAIDDDIKISDIELFSTDKFEDQDKFDSLVEQKISNLTHTLYQSNFSSADTSFDDLLNLWETRLHLGNTQQKLQEKTQQFTEKYDIVNTNEFKNFVEIAPQIIHFLQENYDEVSEIPEIVNAVKLSHAVAVAFDFPKLSYDDLSSAGSYTLKHGYEGSIYEMICRQELVKQELLETKKNFNSIWATNEKIRTLAGLIYEKDDVVEKTLAETINEVPYLALITKKQLKETINNCLSISEGHNTPSQDIQRFVNKLFELKRPVKEQLISMLNEKYGVNVSTLKESMSFKSLLNTQVVIFESLSKLSPKNSVQRQVLSEVATMLSKKSGIEGIDINDYLYELFSEAGYDKTLNEAHRITNYLDFDEVANDLADIGDVLRLIRQNSKTIDSGQEEQYPSDENLEGDALDMDSEGDDVSEPAMDAEEVPIPPEEGQVEAEGGPGEEPAVEDPGAEE